MRITTEVRLPGSGRGLVLMDDLVATMETTIVIVNVEDIPLSCVEHSSLQACVYYSWVRFR
jgi:hypothetical protein